MRGELGGIDEDGDDGDVVRFERSAYCQKDIKEVWTQHGSSCEGNLT